MFQADPNLIKKQLADQSHAFTSFSPEIRSRQEIEGFAGEVQGVYDELSKYAKTEAQQAFLFQEMQRFQSRYAELYNAHLAAKGRCYSILITGGSNFNNAMHEKRNRTEDNKYAAMKKFKERVAAAILRELKKMAVEEAGGELEVLQRKIDEAEINHAAMVASNKIIKKKGATQEEKVRSIIDVTGFKEETVLKMFKPDYMGNLGFPGWALQNSNANINRMKARLEELQKKEATPTSDLSFDGGNIRDNAEADRVQILFDERPDAEMISKLKGSGWRWSPSNVAWQRKRTPQAIQNARQIVGLE